MFKLLQFKKFSEMKYQPQIYKNKEETAQTSQEKIA